jgi:hypothetical protein
MPAHHDRRRQFCAIRSYLSTAAKHGLAFFDALVMLTSCRPWSPPLNDHIRIAETWPVPAGSLG